MDDNKSINVTGIGEVRFVSKNILNFFRRTTILYGASETGKSTIIFWILKILALFIPCVVCISPTAMANNAWKGYIPDRFVISNVKCALKTLHMLFKRQQMAVEIYNRASDLTTLESLVQRSGDRHTYSEAHRIQDEAVRALDKIERADDLDYAKKKSFSDDIKEKLRGHKVARYKACIKKYRETLIKKDLSENELFAIKYLHFNPSILLIMDDCAAQIELWGKDPIIAEIFFNGRHWWITSVYTMQDDKRLLTGIRKNTFNSIFTEANCAVSFFTNKPNGFTKKTAALGEALAQKLFEPNADGSKNHKKMVYSRMDPVQQMRYILADTYPTFKFGARSLWALSTKVPSDEKAKELEFKQSPFARSFTTT